MTTLTVRRLLIDLEPPIARHWCAGDPFRTAFFNALSMAFPLGEQFFIDCIKEGFKALPQDKQDKMQSEIQNFIGQEATHRRIHSLFNAHIEKEGFINGWAQRQVTRQANLRSLPNITPLDLVAITAANEHITAIFADWALKNPQLFDDTEERLSKMWEWHCAEETEHRATAFDLFYELGGTYELRTAWFKKIALLFICNVYLQTLSNLKVDGTLWTWRTWASGLRHIFGMRGFITSNMFSWVSYFRKNFHPSKSSSDKSAQWLEDNQSAFTIVGRKLI